MLTMDPTSDAASPVEAPLGRGNRKKVPSEKARAHSEAPAGSLSTAPPRKRTRVNGSSQPSRRTGRVSAANTSVEHLHLIHKILARRDAGDGTRPEVKVWWVGCTENEATWEPAQNMSDDFPLPANTAWLTMSRTGDDDAAALFEPPMEGQQSSFEARYEQFVYVLQWDMQ